MRGFVTATSVCITAIAASFAWAQPPQQDPPAAPAGRGAGRGGGGRGGDRLSFPQQTRPLAAPEVIARGKAVYGVNCTACHGGDLRGGDQGGPSLLRSLAALSDQHGETRPIIHGSRQDKGMPAFNLSDADSVAVAEYIHSVLAQVGGRRVRRELPTHRRSTRWWAVRPPARPISRPSAPAAIPVEGDLKGIAAKFEDPRDLQNTWVSGGGGGGGGGRGGGGGGKPAPVAS